MTPGVLSPHDTICQCPWSKVRHALRCMLLCAVRESGWSFGPTHKFHLGSIYSVVLITSNHFFLLCQTAKFCSSIILSFKPSIALAGNVGASLGADCLSAANLAALSASDYHFHSVFAIECPGSFMIGKDLGN